MWKVEIERLTKEVRILIGEQRNPDNDVAKDRRRASKESIGGSRAKTRYLDFPRPTALTHSVIPQSLGTVKETRTGPEDLLDGTLILQRSPLT